MIPYGKQTVDRLDIDAVIRALESDFLTQGNLVPQFEKELSSVVGAKYAAVTTSATAALHLACLSLNVNENSIVWTTPISFVATANAALYCKAKIDFVDAEPSNGCISPLALEAKLIEAEKNGSLPNVVITVNLNGYSPNMAKIKNLSNRYGFNIIEDASHALGAEYNGSKVGSCKYSDITVFSFHPVKMITTGEGGAISTNSEALFYKFKLLRSHGITKNAEEFKATNFGGWHYEQHYLGFNYRMTEIQAALGISQLGKLNEFVNKRSKIASAYNEAFSELNIELPPISKENISSFHLYRIGVCEEKRERLYYHLHDNGIAVQVHYIPIHTQPFYQKLGFKAGQFPNSELYYKKSISLPIFPSLAEPDLEFIIEQINIFHQS